MATTWEGRPRGVGGDHVRAYMWTPHNYHESHVAFERKRREKSVVCATCFVHKGSK